MGTCKKVLRATAALVEQNLVLTLPSVGTISNGDVISFCIINTVDQTNPTGTVSMSIDGTTFAVKTRYGNDLRIDQLRSRKIYVVGIGAQTPTATMLTCVPESSFVFPTYGG